MATKDELNALRAEVRKRQRAANAKVSRLRQRGVEVGGTPFDVRRNVNSVKSYNSRQLKSYLNKLNNFTSRSTSFVGDVNGSPIPAQKWRAYKAQERKYNSKGSRELGKFANVKLPFSDATVEQRRNSIVNTNVLRAQGQAVRSPYEPMSRKAGRINGVAALERLTKDMERRNSRTYLADELKNQREQLSDMLTEIGMPEEIARIDALDDDQFNVLFNYTSFITEVSLDYENAKARATGEKERLAENVGENTRREIPKVITWASQLTF